MSTINDYCAKYEGQHLATDTDNLMDNNQHFKNNFRIYIHGKTQIYLHFLLISKAVFKVPEATKSLLSVSTPSCHTVVTNMTNN